MTPFAAHGPRWHAQHPPTGRAFAAALFMHALLFVALSIAVRWNTQPQAPASAQVWGALPAVMQVEPAPRPQPAPKPAPKPKPAPPQPQPQTTPDIVEEQKKQREKERQAQEEKRAQAREREQALEKKRELEKQQLAQREKLREQEAERLARQLGAATSSTSPSPATHANAGAGADRAWQAQVTACIRPHIAFSVPESTSAEVYAEFRLELLPTGEHVAVRRIRASGLAGFDDAAERAIRRCDPIPRRADGTVPRSFVLVVRPVEMR